MTSRNPRPPAPTSPSSSRQPKPLHSTQTMRIVSEHCELLRYILLTLYSNKKLSDKECPHNYGAIVEKLKIALLKDVPRLNASPTYQKFCDIELDDRAGDLGIDRPRSGRGGTNRPIKLSCTFMLGSLAMQLQQETNARKFSMRTRLSVSQIDSQPIRWLLTFPSPPS